jgi:hemerythrin
MSNTALADSLESIHTLPEGLVTGHWYNDLQHTMLVIMFRRALVACRNDRMRAVDKILDNITLYLHVHFLDEEEGLAYSLARGAHDRDGIERHARMHINFLNHWTEEILEPHAGGEDDRFELREKLAAYYKTIIDHIEETDVHTYGEGTEAATHRLSEIANIALSEAPLSPWQKGALGIVEIFSPATANLIDRTRLAPSALEALLSPGMTRTVPRLIEDGPLSGLRDKVFAKLCAV